MSDPFSEMKRCEKGEEHAQHLSLNPNASTESARDKPSAPRSFNFRRAAAAAALVVFGLWSTHTFGATTSHKALSNRISNVEWKGCEALGKEFQCSSVSVPLDYRNAGDERTIKIALTRFLASDQASRWVLRVLLGAYEYELTDPQQRRHFRESWRTWCVAFFLKLEC